MKKKLFIPFFITGIGAIIIIGIGIWYAMQPTPVNTVPPVTLKEPLRIGGIVPLTGDREMYGVPLQRAAQVALDEINRAGGIRGEQVQIIWEDGKCADAAARTAAEKLIKEKRVQFIIGGVCSTETLAIAPLAEEREIIVLSPASTTPAISEAGEYIFRMTPSDAQSGQSAARYAIEKGVKNAAIIYQRAGYARGIKEAFVEAFTALGGEIVSEQSYRTGDRNTAILARNALEKKPDLIYLIPESTTPGLQQLERVKTGEYQGMVMVDEVMLDRGTIAQNVATYEGIIGVEGYFDPAEPRTAAFLDRYQAQFAETPKFPYFMTNMYGAVMLLKDAIEKHGTDTQKVREYLATLKDWPAPTGPLTFDQYGDPYGRFSIVKVVGGVVESLEIKNVAP